MQVNLTHRIDDVPCYQTVHELRWPDGVQCPSCASQHGIKRGLDDTEPARRRPPLLACCAPVPPQRGPLTGGGTRPDPLLAAPHARILVPQKGEGCPYREQGGVLMPTESEKQAEKERVTRISGFRVGYHDFLAEVDLEALKRRNDRWEAEHRHQSLLDRKTEELIRIAAYVAMRNPSHHIQIHVHSAHKAGATPEEIYHIPSLLVVNQ